MQPAALTRAKKHRLRQAEVEADHFRLQLLYQTAHRGVEWSAVGGVDGRGGIKVQLAIIRREPLLPPGFALRVRIDALVAEEVHVDRCRHALADDIDLLARLLDGQHGARQRAQRAALRRRDHQIRIHYTGHRRQHDGKFGFEQVEKSAVGPHDLLIQ